MHVASYLIKQAMPGWLRMRQFRSVLHPVASQVRPVLTPVDQRRLDEFFSWLPPDKQTPSLRRRWAITRALR